MRKTLARLSARLIRGAHLEFSRAKLRARRTVATRRNASPVGAIFSQSGSIAEEIEARLRAATTSIDAALYRFNNLRLSEALQDAQGRGVDVRLIIDHGKFDDSDSTRALLSKAPFPFRLSHGRDGVKSKMHHKFVVLDGRTVLTGSYNWTSASEEENYESLLILQDRLIVGLHCQEFASLWTTATEVQRSESDQVAVLSACLSP